LNVRLKSDEGLVRRASINILLEILLGEKPRKVLYARECFERLQIFRRGTFHLLLKSGLPIDTPDCLIEERQPIEILDRELSGYANHAKRIIDDQWIPECDVVVQRAPGEIKIEGKYRDEWFEEYKKKGEAEESSVEWKYLQPDLHPKEKEGTVEADEDNGEDESNSDDEDPRQQKWTKEDIAKSFGEWAKRQKAESKEKKVGQEGSQEDVAMPLRPKRDS
jgi:hypothetical protein